MAPRPSSANGRDGGRAVRAPVARPAPASRRPTSRQLVIGVIAAVVVIAIAVGGGFYLTRQGSSPTAASAATPGASGSSQDLLGSQVPEEGRTHVAEGSAINYQHNPPASGPHYPSPKTWGIYTTTVAPGYWVHNLEHGGVVVLYDCPSGCSSVVDQLRQAFQSFPKDKYDEVKLVATPYSGLPNHAQVMFVAWDYQKAYDSFDPQKLLAFYNGHVDKAPEDIP